MEDKVREATFNWCDPVGEDYVTDSTEVQDPERGLLLPKDNINRPDHYLQGLIQPIDFIMGQEMDFCAGNVVKYVTRHKYKNGLEDLKKAEFYLKKLIEEYEQ